MKARISLSIFVLAVVLGINVSSASILSSLKYNPYQRNRNGRFVDDYDAILYELMLKAGLNKKRFTNYGTSYDDLIINDYLDSYAQPKVKMQKLDDKAFKLFRRMLEKKLEAERKYF
jgi:hypothetical protein